MADDDDMKEKLTDSNAKNLEKKSLMGPIIWFSEREMSTAGIEGVRRRQLTHNRQWF